jgi:PAS domain S-box-containing protein
MLQIDEGVIVADREGRFVFWNAAARKIVGTGPLPSSPAEWSTVYGLFLPDTLNPYPPDELPLARALRGERVREAEVLIRSPYAPDGTWISVNGGPLRGEGGEVVGGVIVFRDVTAYRRSKDLVRLFSEAIEKTTDSVFITDTNAVIEYVNPAFEVTTGYSREQAIGRRASILKSGWQDPAFYQTLWARILSGEVHSATPVNRRKDGSVFHAEQTITPVRDEAGSITNFVSVMRDVTERKRAQQRDVEMRLARTVQQKLYPGAAPRLAGFDLAGAAFPDQTGGDYRLPPDGGRPARPRGGRRQRPRPVRCLRRRAPTSARSRGPPRTSATCWARSISSSRTRRTSGSSRAGGALDPGWTSSTRARVTSRDTCSTARGRRSTSWPRRACRWASLARPSSGPPRSCPSRRETSSCS